MSLPNDFKLSSKVFEILDGLPKDFLSILNASNSKSNKIERDKEEFHKSKYESKDISNSSRDGKVFGEGSYRSSFGTDSKDWDKLSNADLKPAFLNPNNPIVQHPGVMMSSNWDIETPYVKKVSTKDECQSGNRKDESWTENSGNSSSHMKESKFSSEVKRENQGSSINPSDPSKNVKKPVDKVSMEKQKNILSKIWKLKEQKKKLEMQRDSVIANHKGDFKNIESILEENCSLISEIENQVALLNNMVQRINEESNLPHAENEKISQSSSGKYETVSNITKRKSEFTEESASKANNKFLKPNDESDKYSKSHSESDKEKEKDFFKRYREKYSTSEDKDIKNELSKRERDAKHKVPNYDPRSYAKPSYREKDYGSENHKSSSHRSIKTVNETSKIDDEKLELDSKIKSKSIKSTSSSEQNWLSMQMNIFNEEIHWCKLCNFFSNAFGEYMKHLNEFNHIIKNQNTNSSKILNLQEVDKDKNFKSLPSDSLLLGTEFLQSITVYSCSLCPNSILKSTDEVRHHLRSDLHVSKHKEYMAENKSYEITHYKEKIAAYVDYVSQAKYSQPPTSDVASESSSSRQKDLASGEKKSLQNRDYSSISAHKATEKKSDSPHKRGVHSTSRSSEKNLFPCARTKKNDSIRKKIDEQFKSFFIDDEIEAENGSEDASNEGSKDEKGESDSLSSNSKEAKTKIVDTSKEKSVSGGSGNDSKFKKPLNIMIGKMPFLKKSKKLPIKTKCESLVSSSLTDVEKRLVELTSSYKENDSTKLERSENIIMPPDVPRGVEYITEIFNCNKETSFTKKIGPTLQNNDENVEKGSLDLRATADTNEVPMELCDISLPDNSTESKKAAKKIKKTDMPIHESHTYQYSTNFVGQNNSQTSNYYQQSNSAYDNYFLSPDYNSSVRGGVPTNIPFDPYSVGSMPPIPNFQNNFNTVNRFMPPNEAYGNSFQQMPAAPPNQSSNLYRSQYPPVPGPTTYRNDHIPSPRNVLRQVKIDPPPPGTECSTNYVNSQSGNENSVIQRKASPIPGNDSTNSHHKENAKSSNATKLAGIPARDKDRCSSGKLKSANDNESELTSVGNPESDSMEPEDSLIMEGLELLEDADNDDI